MNKPITFNMANIAFSSLILMSFMSHSQEQNCYTNNLLATTLTENFVVLVDQVSDTKTKLTWQRCAYGQQWNISTNACDGDPVRVNWQNALTIAEQFNTTEVNQWRLPNIKELATIVEKQCVSPAINITLFPNTPSETYWTGSTTVNAFDKAWAIAFYNGRNSKKLKSSDNYIRLVKFTE